MLPVKCWTMLLYKCLAFLCGDIREVAWLDAKLFTPCRFTGILLWLIKISLIIVEMRVRSVWIKQTTSTLPFEIVIDTLYLMIVWSIKCVPEQLKLTASDKKQKSWITSGLTISVGHRDKFRKDCVTIRNYKIYFLSNLIKVTKNNYYSYSVKT